MPKKNKINSDETKNINILDLKGFIDSCPFYIMLIDEDHHIILANSAVGNFFGKNSDALIDKYCPKVIHGMDTPYPGCPLEDSKKIGAAVEKELFDKKSGHWTKSAVYPTKYKTEEGKALFIHIVQDITEKKQTEEKNIRNHQIQNAIDRFLHISLMNIPLDQQLQKILEHLLSIPWITIERKGAIFLIENELDKLVMKAHYGLNDNILNKCKYVNFGQCLCGMAVLSGRIEYSDSIDKRHEITYDGMYSHGHYCVPIKSDGGISGVINLYLAPGHKRDDAEEKFLQTVAEVLAGIINRNRIEERLKTSVENLRNNMEGIIELIALIVETRDPYTAGHQRRVTSLACAIALEMGLEKEKIDGIRMAGTIHDLGKISIPAEILSKPSCLTDIEYSMIKIHPQSAYNMLKTINFPWPVAQIVYQHHERIDGSGYPQGLSGEKIYLEAKIIAVADVVEAIASHRPYRPGLGIDTALDEIFKNKGILYDPDVVDICIKLFKEKKIKLT